MPRSFLTETTADSFIIAQISATPRPTHPATTGLFIQSLNDLIDADGKRYAELDRSVPETIVLILPGAFLAATAILGYASGVTGHRPSLVAYLLLALIVIIVFIIIDLDRPRRGLIRVNQGCLTDLHAAMTADVASDDPRGYPAMPNRSPPPR
jgi:hypothetical protein